MYYLKNTNFWMFGLFFFFYFFIMGAYFPFFPIWLHDINHISKVIRVLFLPLFLCSRYYSNRCLVCFLTNSGCANTCCGLLPAC
ncbi:lactose permease [Escherichia coli]|nr:lactose permease [Escherichia coli]